LKCSFQTGQSTHYQAIFFPNFDLEIFKVQGHNPEKLSQQAQVQYFKNVYAKYHQSEINRNMIFRPDKLPPVQVDGQTDRRTDGQTDRRTAEMTTIPLGPIRAEG